MCFEIDASGIRTRLRINGYRPTAKDHWDDEWCRCDFLFSSGKWLNYHKENEEVLLSAEVEELEKAFTELLNNNLSEMKEIICMEPDFVFKLYPQTDLRNNPNYVYIQPGCEIQDIYLEWRIYFWNEGLTDNFLTITFKRDEIAAFRDYLTQVINRRISAD